ncbi:hypothetical protein FSARC_7144 [Fusarium sarcochroum]|uniref:Peptidase S8/S53 domain-containing protein n=1 Tax=Fusarium sarcochroum TaxID=1208366 RepID=A0A8H4X8M0_9HYPO|nr:hypothetical protein FSARC_7144 [Fusarium sarcochroum]
MPSVAFFVEGIGDTIEYKLICKLQQFSAIISQPRELAQCSTRTQELRNAINGLDVQIHRTFTALQLDLILYLELEIGDEESESSSDTDTDENIDQDRSQDDASSSSSLDSKSTAHSHDTWNPLNNAKLSSVEDALSHITELCSLLEARVNPLMIPILPEDSDQAQAYPRLTRLINHLKDISEAGDTVDLIPSHRRTKAEFLFNIASDKENADAFISFCDPDQPRPHKRRLCYALSNSYEDDRDLEFYVSDDHASHEYSSITVKVPKGSKRTRLYDDNCPDDKKSLWDLVKNDYFKRKKTGSFLWSTDEKAELVQLDQRKSLAAKLVIGLMLSIDSEHVLESWNPRRIYFLKPAGAHYSPFVPLATETDKFRLRKCLKLHPADALLEDGHALQPLPQFMLLAKALYQIGDGDTLDRVKLPRASGEALRNSWKRLRTIVEEYPLKDNDKFEVDLEALPFIKAAEGCLNFHVEYQKNIIGVDTNQRIIVAWQVVFETILAEIDVDLKSLLIAPSSGVGTSERPPTKQPGDLVASPTPSCSANSPTKTSFPSNMFDSGLSQEFSTQDIHVKSTLVNPCQYTVLAKLFDEPQTGNSSTHRADDFWERLDKFHRSYSHSVTTRTTRESGADFPRRIRIAVLDTGFDFECPYIKGLTSSGRVRKEWCHSWVGDGVNDGDEELHGTNCAYLLHKTAPEADIYIAKVFEENLVKFYQAENIAKVRHKYLSEMPGVHDQVEASAANFPTKAIKYAADVWDVDIISMSFGLRLPQTQGNKSKDDSMRQDYEKIIEDIKTAIRDASIRSPRLMFAAASNNGKNEHRAFSARYSPHVFCVHASDGYGEDGGINPKTEGGLNFMTLGMDLELFGKREFPKGGRLIPKYSPVVKSGTSLATPVAAGIAATVLDLGARVRRFDDKIGKKLRRPEEMEKVLRLMSEAKNDFGGRLHYMAPWRFWNNGWEINDGRARWDAIEEELRVW